MKALWVMMIVTTLVIMFIFFYAFIVMTSEQAVRIADEVQTVVPPPERVVESEQVNQMPDDQGEGFDDPVVYSFGRDDPATLQQLSLKHKGMTDLDQLDRHLQQGDYISILKSLWTENQKDRRYNWLEEKRAESHPILLFELAVESIKQDPSLNGFVNALFLLEFAKDRTEMDAACVTDNSAEDAANSLYKIYAQSVAHVIKSDSGLYDQIQQMPKGDLSKQILQKLLAALKETEANFDKLPSPNWVSHHALKRLFSNQNLLSDADDCKQKRLDVLKALIAKTEGQLNSPAS